MWSSDFQYHGKNDLCSNIYVPHAGDIFIISLEHPWWQELFTNLDFHANDEQHKTQIDKLDPAYCSHSLCEDILLVDRPSQFSALLNQKLNEDISDDDEDCNSTDRSKHYPVLDEPFLAMCLTVKWKFEGLNGLEATLCI